MGVVAVVLSALNGVFQTALYRYAAGGAQQTGPFDAGALAASFGPRRRRAF